MHLLNHGSFVFCSSSKEFFVSSRFLPIMIITSILFTCAFIYILWLCLHNFVHRYCHRLKFGSSSTSSSNQFVEMPVQKTLSNGTRYDLIKDTPPPSSSTALWTDTIGSGIRLQCCSTTTASASSHSDHEPHLVNIHKNPINSLLQQSKQQPQLNPYATTGIFQSTETETNHAAQYQPPWFDHQPPSPSYACQHCATQSHPHTPTSIRTTLRSLSAQRTINDVKTSTFESHAPM